MPGLVIGTPAYMSPEQARGIPVDARTDIFSLGCVLFELVSGRPAVTGNTPSDVIASTFTEQPIPIACLGSICPPALLRVIGKATEKHRDKRYQTSAEMLADLRNIRPDMPTAHPWARRRLYRSAASAAFTRAEPIFSSATARSGS